MWGGVRKANNSYWSECEDKEATKTQKPSLTESNIPESTLHFTSNTLHTETVYIEDWHKHMHIAKNKWKIFISAIRILLISPGQREDAREKQSGGTSYTPISALPQRGNRTGNAATGFLTCFLTGKEREPPPPPPPPPPLPKSSSCHERREWSGTIGLQRGAECTWCLHYFNSSGTTYV